MPELQQTSVPEGWIEIESDRLKNIEKIWERIGDGLSIGIVNDYEDSPNEYAVVVLSGSHIESYGDDGMLWSFDRMDYVEEGARQFMQNHTNSEGFGTTEIGDTVTEKIVVSEPEPEPDFSEVFNG